LFKLRGVRQAPPDVIIVTLDKNSADHLYLSSDPVKWPRSFHAQLIRNLVAEDVAVIAFDIIFSEARNPEYDKMFAAAIRDAGNVVLCDRLKKEKIPLTQSGGEHYVHVETIVPPIPPLAQSAMATCPFPLPKVPVRLNSYWTFKTEAGDTPSLPVVAFQIFAMPVLDEFLTLFKQVSPNQFKTFPVNKDKIIEKKEVKKLVHILRSIFENEPQTAEAMLAKLKAANTRIGDPNKHQILKSLIRMYQNPDSLYLNFYGPPGTVTTVPYYQILQGSASKIKQLDLAGKAVFVGLSEQLRPEQKDGFYTVFSQPDGLDISGVEVAASAFANLLEDMPVKPMRVLSYIAFIFFWGVLVGLLCIYCNTIIAAGSVIGLSVFYLIFAHFQFKQYGLWYPLVIPLLLQAPVAFFGCVLCKYFDTSKERQNIRKAFGFYLPENIIDQLVKNISPAESAVERVYGTCLITDAKDYTALSEKMEPEELSKFINKYFEVIFTPVRRNSGIISDVKGDSMLAFWTAAQPDAKTGDLACQTALDIMQAVHQFNRISSPFELPTRIGIHSGYMSLGNVGAVDHFEYRPIGDIVNTTSRMEKLNKKIHTRLLVSEEVLYQLENFLVRNLGKFTFAGKSKPIVVYEIICRKEQLNKRKETLCKVFSRGLTAFQGQSWSEAKAVFKQAIRIRKNDGPSLYYIEKCESYRHDSPGPDWDGSICLQSK
jgi:adenylate cyclase